MNLFTSPELYPLRIDFTRGVVTFLRMNQRTYRESVFLDERTRYLEADIELKLHDLLLASESAPVPAKRVHYIFNTAFCGSTLLARYFELLPSCFVLKEPRLLAQLAGQEDVSSDLWNRCFHLCIRLLSRTYDPDQVVFVKPLETCNRLGNALLAHSFAATATFLAAPLKYFLLAILKSADRRRWICQRAQTAGNDLPESSSLRLIDPRVLTVPQSAAYVWSVDCVLRAQILSENAERVFPLSSERLVESPMEALSGVAKLCGLHLDPEQLKWMIDHPSAQRYSKDSSRPYDRSTRDLELKELERCWGAEAQAGIEWALAHTVSAGVGPVQ